MRFLISALSVIFVVSFTTTGKTGDGYLIQDLAVEQSKIVKDEINDRGSCRVMNGTLVWKCGKSKKDSKENFKGSGKRMTIDQIVNLGTYYVNLGTY